MALLLLLLVPQFVKLIERSEGLVEVMIELFLERKEDLMGCHYILLIGLTPLNYSQLLLCYILN